MSDSWGELFRRSIESLVEQSAALLPRIIVSAVLILVGFLLAAFAQVVVRTVMRRAGLDRLAELIGVGRFLSRFGYENPASHLAGFLTFWTVLAVFLLTGADTVGLPAVSETIGRLIAMIPTLALVVLVLLLGLSLARTARRTVEGVSERTRLTSARPLGIAAYYMVVALTVVVGLSGLGVDFTIIIAVLVVILASLGVGVAVMLGLGSRDVARNTISGIYVRKELGVGDRIRVGELTGEIATVGQVVLTVKDKGRTWLIPHADILTSAVEVLSRATTERKT